MTRRIGIGNTKGGVGKTTTTLYLAAAARARGLSVEVIDLDKQGSATEWLDEVGPVDGLASTVGNMSTLKRQSRADIVLIDTSPGDPRDLEGIATTCDFVVVPSSPGDLNVTRTLATVSYLAALGVPHAVVLTQTAHTIAMTDGRARLLEATAVFDAEIPHREEIKRAAGTIPVELHGYDALLTEILGEVES